MTNEALLQGGRNRLEELFEELAAELEKAKVQLAIYMVGGSWLMWFDERDATRDVDSVDSVSDAAARAIARVAERHDLSPKWVNGHAASFKPAGFDARACEVVFERAFLIVRLPPAETIFVMKLNRGDPPDRDDMIRIWPRCSFGSAEAAVAAFYDAYPHEERDDHLVDHVQGIIEDAEPDTGA